MTAEDYLYCIAVLCVPKVADADVPPAEQYKVIVEYIVGGSIALNTVTQALIDMEEECTCS